MMALRYLWPDRLVTTPSVVQIYIEEQPDEAVLCCDGPY